MPGPDEGSADAPFMFRFLNLTKGTVFRVVDKTTKFAKSAPAVGNTMTSTFEPVPSNYWWEVEREVVESNSANVVPVQLFVGSPDIAGSFRDGSADGRKTVADNRSVIRIGPGEVLSAVWTNANPGDIGWLTIQVQILTKD